MSTPDNSAEKGAGTTKRYEYGIHRKGDRLRDSQHREGMTERQARKWVEETESWAPGVFTVVRREVMPWERVLPPAESEHRWIAEDSQCWCGFRAKPFQERTRYEQYLDHLASVLPPEETSR